MPDLMHSLRVIHLHSFYITSSPFNHIFSLFSIHTFSTSFYHLFISHLTNGTQNYTYMYLLFYFSSIYTRTPLFYHICTLALTLFLHFASFIHFHTCTYLSLHLHFPMTSMRFFLLAFTNPCDWDQKSHKRHFRFRIAFFFPFRIH